MVKNRKVQNLLIGFLAATLGLSTYVYMQTLNSKATSGAESVSVYFATEEIPAGTTFASMLQSSLISMKQIPSSVASGTVVRSVDDFSENEVTKSATEAGQLILRGMFTPPSKFANGLNIPKGSLAVSISVEDVSRVANFVVPGSRVVIFTTGFNNKGTESITRVLVANALVLAIGSEVSTPTNGVQVTASPLVTLAVNPLEAEQLIHASQNTKLSFALAHGNEPNSMSLPRTGTSNAALFRED